MKIPVYYDISGALPLYDCAKSPNVHVWFPDYGWRREGKPSRKFMGDKVLLPRFEVEQEDFEDWLYEQAELLPNPRGSIFVAICSAHPGPLVLGVFHDKSPLLRWGRPHPEWSTCLPHLPLEVEI